MNYDSLIGLEKSNVTSLLEKEEIRFRITREDNTDYFVTMELDPMRVNLEFDKNKLTSYRFG